MATGLLIAATEAKTKLPLPPVGYAVIAMIAFAALLAVTFAFRNVGKRH